MFRMRSAVGSEESSSCHVPLQHPAHLNTVSDLLWTRSWPWSCFVSEKPMKPDGRSLKVQSDKSLLLRVCVCAWTWWKAWPTVWKVCFQAGLELWFYTVTASPRLSAGRFKTLWKNFHEFWWMRRLCAKEQLIWFWWWSRSGISASGPLVFLNCNYETDGDKNFRNSQSCGYIRGIKTPCIKSYA